MSVFNTLHIMLALFLSYMYVAIAMEEEDKNHIKPFHLVSGAKHMSRIGFGTAALGENTKNIVCSALANGFRLFDTAQAKEWYDENDLGNALEECWKGDFDELMIVTKVHPRSFSPNSLEESISNSKRHIYRTDRPIDVVLLHAPYCWRGHCTPEQEKHTWQSAWKTLEKLKTKGDIHAIGVSNFDRNLLRQLVDIADKKISVVQNWMDPFNQDRDVRELCKREGIVYMAYSALGTQWEHKLGYNPVFRDPTLEKIARKHQRSIAQVVISWAVQEDTVIIPRATKSEHIAGNARMLDSEGRPQAFLDREDLESIRDLDGTLGSLW